MDVHPGGIERRALLPVPALIVFGTAAWYALGYWLGLPWLVPVLNTVPALIALRASLQRGEMATAVTRMLLWAATLGVCATLLSYSTPEQTGRLFLNGDRYRTEMFNWVLTGTGAESRPREFVPVHLAHASIFVMLSLGSGSILSLPMGAVLMNYMGHFVGALAAVSRHPVATMIAAWHPWSVGTDCELRGAGRGAGGTGPVARVRFPLPPGRPQAMAVAGRRWPAAGYRPEDGARPRVATPAARSRGVVAREACPARADGQAACALGNLRRPHGVN